MIPLHPKDKKYFEEFPSEILEALQKLHFTNINHTLAYYGILLYSLTRAIGAKYVLEIGHAECASAYYLASGIKDHARRFNISDPMYYGIDIIRTEIAKRDLASKGLPHTIINMDTINLTSETFKGITFDLIFQDGAHDRDHVVHEMEVLYPQLKDKGEGYWIAHDCYGPSEQGFREIIANPKYKFEYCRIFDNTYGLAIMRKMDNYDYSKWHWYEHAKKNKGEK